MEDAAHEGDFSSQSASTISQCRRGADGRVRIELSDGSSFFVSDGFFAERGLLSGLALSRELLEAVEHEGARISAWDKSGELLARRDHSAFELSQKLKSRGFGRDAIESVVDKLKEVGFLDDRRFAEAWVRSRLRRHPEGRSRLLAGLVRRGVDRATIAEVLAGAFTEETAEDAISRAAEKMQRGGTIDNDRLLRKLLSRGFTYRQATAYLQKL